MTGEQTDAIAPGIDPDPIPSGTRGTVRRHLDPGGPLEQIAVDWDIARSLARVPRVDRFRILDDKET